MMNTQHPKKGKQLQNQIRLLFKLCLNFLVFYLILSVILSIYTDCIHLLDSGPISLSDYFEKSKQTDVCDESN